MRQRYLALSSTLALYLLEDEAIIYSSNSRRLFGLDRKAAFLLLRLADGESIEKLTAELGLNDADVSVAAELSLLLRGHEPLSDEYRAETFCPRTPPQATVAPLSYRLLTTIFTFDCPDAMLYDLISSDLRHLSVMGEQPVNLIVRLEPDGHLWRLNLNGAAQCEPLPADMMLPLLHGRLRSFAYQRFPYLLAVHAAVVSRGRHTVVMPGLSGSGKSTLAAAMLAADWHLLSDEVALLDSFGNLVPLPLSLCLKEGSWPLLHQAFPELQCAAVHKRWDGLRVRYLNSGMIAFAGSRLDCRATHLVFPQFQPETVCGVERLSPVNALRRLTDSGYRVPGLSRDDAGRIVDWITGLTSFVLNYSSSGEALRLLETALADHE